MQLFPTVIQLGAPTASESPASDSRPAYDPANGDAFRAALSAAHQNGRDPSRVERRASRPETSETTPSMDDDTVSADAESTDDAPLSADALAALLLLAPAPATPTPVASSGTSLTGTAVEGEAGAVVAAGISLAAIDQFQDQEACGRANQLDDIRHDDRHWQPGAILGCGQCRPDQRHDNEEEEKVEQKVVKRNAKNAAAIVDSIKVKVIAKMEQVAIEIENEKRPISVLKIENMNAGVIMKTSYTELTLKLQDIIVNDMNTETIHSTVMLTKRKIQIKKINK